jgi:hypothetical protein
MSKKIMSRPFCSRESIQNLVNHWGSQAISTLIILSSTFLLYQYREGGVKDAGLPYTSIRDVGGYITTGLKIMDKVNPYIPDGTLWGGARWGTFGTVPVAMISELIPRALQVVFFQIIGLLGLYLFIRTIFRKISNLQANVIYLLLIWSSSFREMLTTNQIIGMVLGLIAIGMRSLFAEQYKKTPLIQQILGTLCFVIALDLKPHISGLLIVGLYIYFRRGVDFLKLVGAYLITHAAVDIYIGRVVEIDWLKILSGLNEKANRNELGDSVTFWPVVRRFVNIDSSFGLVSKATLLVLILLTFTYAYKRNWQVFIFLSLFAPSFTIYFHYYDAVPFFGLVFWVILSRPKSIFSFLILDILLISKESSSLRNIALVVVVSFLVAIFSATTNSNRNRNLVFAVIGFALWQLIQIANSNSGSDQYELQSLVVTQVLILSGLLFIRSLRGSPKLDNFALIKT